VYKHFNSGMKFIEDNLVICQAKNPKVQKMKKQLEEHEHKLFEKR